MINKKLKPGTSPGVLTAEINGQYDDQIIMFLEANMTEKQIAEGRRLANEHLEQMRLEKDL